MKSTHRKTTGDGRRLSSALHFGQLHFVGLQGDRDAHLTALNVQWQHATTLAAQHGYRAITRTIIPHAPHDPFPARVFAALNRMRTNISSW